MAADWIFRATVAVGLILLGWLAFRLAQRANLRRADEAARRIASGPNDVPTIVYFTTPDCAPCKTIQRPALRRLAEMLQDQLRVIEVNTYEDPEMAKEWGVMSVPTTFILDAAGAPKQVNYGATRAEKLLEQVRRVHAR